MDKNYHTACPKVLYRAIDDRRVFPQIHVDQVDGKHIYVPFQKQVGALTYMMILNLQYLIEPPCQIIVDRLF